MPTPTAYQQLERRFARIADLDNALGILNWDQQTMMPDGAAEARADAIAALSVMRHEALTDPRVAEWLEAAAASPAEGPHGDWRAANLREMRRIVMTATAVPADLVEANAKAISACEMTWRRARKEKSFPLLLPTLAEVLRLQRLIAAARGQALGLTPYDALMNEWEPGASAARIDVVFDDLAGFLPGFIDAAIERQKGRPAAMPLAGPFPIQAQRAVGLKFMEAVGFDFSRGRLDVSLHPFCGGAEDDVRITTRYDEADFTRALMGVLHETGHAMYEQGRPRDWRRQPVGLARGMSVHESQSLIVEMQACRSAEFLEFAAPILKEAFGNGRAGFAADNLHRIYTRVERSFIRVDADEATYPTHVILRYRLERAMVAGDMEVGDLPGAWNEGMRALLGIVPADDALGCLQDIHWPGGAWGYFPTYTLGAMTAAQLFDAATSADPGILPGIARGDFRPLMSWLGREVHQRGSLLSTDELIAAATGRPLDAAVFKRHLARRYLDAD